jgi:hypothetical protein
LVNFGARTEGGLSGASEFEVRVWSGQQAKTIAWRARALAPLVVIAGLLAAVRAVEKKGFLSSKRLHTNQLIL